MNFVSNDDGLKTLVTLAKTDVKDVKTYADETLGECADMTHVTLVTLKSSGWNSNNQQTKTVSEIVADEAAQLIMPLGHADSRTAYNDAGIHAVAQGAGTITFEYDTAPTEDIKVWVSVKDVVDVTPPQ